MAERREACRFNLFDSVLALNGALIVNAAILVLAAAVFFKHGILVTQIEQAQLLLTPLFGNGAGGEFVRGGAPGQRAIVDAHRNLRGADCDGRVPQSKAAAVAAAASHSGDRDHSCRADYLLFRRQRHVQAFDTKPGDFKHAVAICGDPADSFYQRFAAHGWIRQSRLGESAGLELGGADHCSEFVAGGDYDRSVDGGERVALAGGGSADCDDSGVTGTRDFQCDHHAGA